MTNYDLSILIPSKNEMFVGKTVDSLLQKIRGKTEIIVVLDGEWGESEIADDPRVTVVYSGTSIGQRAATRLACRLSQAKYVMKLDAHCELGEGFDLILMEDMKDHYTILPLMRNLHAFDWVCIGTHERSGLDYVDEPLSKMKALGCGHTIYQGPTPKKCPNCSGNMERVLVWKAKERPKSTAFRFDKTLHFQYWNDFKKRPEGQGDLTDTLSAQGSCFMMTREKYWALDIDDPQLAGKTGWGQQGVEVALKTWLSGGELKVNHRTYYAHMFRTQGGDFSFPFDLSGKEVEETRKKSRALWLEGHWDKALPGRDLTWLLDKFYPVPEWHTEENKAKKPTKGVIYYTHNMGDKDIIEGCRKQILKGMKEKHIISASREPIQFGKQNIVIKPQNDSGWLDMCRKIVAALEASTADIIFFTEHDVLYHPKHFDFIPPKKDVYYYNTNVWRVRASDGFALYCDGLQQLSGLVAYRETVLTHYKKRLRILEEKWKELHEEKAFNKFVRAMSFEPGTHGRAERVDDLKSENYLATFPNIDIRHDTNATASRWSKEQFRNERYTKGWKEAKLPMNYLAEFEKASEYLAMQ